MAALEKAQEGKRGDRYVVAGSDDRQRQAVGALRDALARYRVDTGGQKWTREDLHQRG